MINHDTLWKAVEDKQAHYARLVSMPLPETVANGLPFFRRGMTVNQQLHFLAEPEYHWIDAKLIMEDDLMSDDLKETLDASLGFARRSGKTFMTSGICKEAIEGLLAGFKGKTINKSGMIEIDSIPYPYSLGKSDISGFLRRDLVRRGYLHSMVPDDAQSGSMELDLSVPIQQPQKWEDSSVVKDITDAIHKLKVSSMKMGDVEYRPEQLEAMGILDEMGAFDSVGCWSAISRFWGGGILTNLKAKPDGTIEADVTLPAIAKGPIVFEQKTKATPEYSPQYAAYTRDREREKEVQNSKRCPTHKRKTKVVNARKAAKAARKKRK